MKSLVLLLLFVPALALAQPPTKIIVWYDRDTMTVIETVIPDNDEQGAKVFSARAHPVQGVSRPAVRVEITRGRMNAVGFARALEEVAPGIMTLAQDGGANVRMLGDQVDTMLAENKVRAALARE